MAKSQTLLSKENKIKQTVIRICKMIENDDLFVVVLDYKNRDVIRKDKCRDIIAAKRRFDIYSKQFA